MSERWIHATARPRLPPHLDEVALPPPPDPSPAELAALARADGRAHVITGGEPTLRADLPALIAELPMPTLRTDGLALATTGALGPLRARGLAAVRVRVHAAQPAAHDFLVRTPGAAKRAMRALLLAAEAGLRTEIEATVTRVNGPVLPELLELAERLGVRAVHLHRLTERGPAVEEALAVRFGLLETPLEAARTAATRGRVALVLHGFPRCAFPRLGGLLAPVDAIEHAFVDAPAWAEARAGQLPAARVACASCPADRRCAGAPLAYVTRFGGGELGVRDGSDATS